MDELEIGFYSAVAIYGLIFTWTLLVRLRWLPAAVVRLVHRPMNRLGRIPFLGRVVNVCRKYPLSLGLVLAILAGVAMPYFVLSVFWVFQALFVAMVIGLMRYVGDDVDDDESYGALSGNYYSYYDNDIVSGHDPHADISRPTLGNVCSKL